MGNVEIKTEKFLAEAKADDKGRKAKLLVSDPTWLNLVPSSP